MCALVPKFVAQCWAQRKGWMSSPISARRCVHRSRQESHFIVLPNQSHSPPHCSNIRYSKEAMSSVPGATQDPERAIVASIAGIHDGTLECKSAPAKRNLETEASTYSPMVLKDPSTNAGNSNETLCIKGSTKLPMML